jgi:hypothetical protein
MRDVMPRIDRNTSAVPISTVVDAEAPGGKVDALEIVSVRNAERARSPIDEEAGNQAGLFGGDEEDTAFTATRTGSWWEALRGAARAFSSGRAGQTEYMAVADIDAAEQPGTKGGVPADPLVMLVVRGAYKKSDRTESQVGFLLNASGVQKEDTSRKAASDRVHQLLSLVQQDMAEKTEVCPFALTGDCTDSEPMGGYSFVGTHPVWHGMLWRQESLNTFNLRATAASLQRLRSRYLPGSPNAGEIVDVLTYLLLDLPALKRRVDIDQKGLRDEFKASFDRGRELCHAAGNRPA